MKRIPKTEEQLLVRAIFDNGRVKAHKGNDLHEEFRHIPMADTLGMEETELIEKLIAIDRHGVY